MLPTGRWYGCRLDVTDREGWDDALASFSAAAGERIDVVANNAGIAFGGPLIQHSKREIDMLVDVNIRGMIYGAQASFSHLKKTAPGSCLLNTASAAGIYGTANMAVYSASKFAVRGLTEALDVEWAGAGIKVHSLMPSFIDTPLLAKPSNARSSGAMRDKVSATGQEFTPVEEVAQAAWDAVHGDQLHSPVGKTARKLAFAARWTPGMLRNKMRGRKTRK
jgi:NAD(P)-dependent dehydrogenase (short-subunit alcohol dehydrogenase family)